LFYIAFGYDHYYTRRNTDDARQALQWLAEDGVIKHRTLPRIRDIELASSLLVDFKVFSDRYQIDLLSIEDVNSILYYRCRVLNRDFTIDLSYRNFMEEFGSLLTGEPYDSDLGIDYPTLINTGRISDSNSFDDIVEYLIETAKRLGIPMSKNISVKHVDSLYNDVSFYYSNSYEYFVVGLNDFVGNFKLLLFFDEVQLAEKLIKHIVNNSTHYTPSDYAHRNEVRGYGEEKEDRQLYNRQDALYRQLKK